MDASYFNHKSFGEEMLLEKIDITILKEKFDHFAPMQTKMHSNFININLSYGCMFSLCKVISALVEEEVDIKRSK